MIGLQTLSQRIRALSVGLVLGTALSVGLAVYVGYHILLDLSQIQGLEAALLPESQRLADSLGELQHDVRFMASLPAVRSVVREHQALGAASPEWRDRGADILEALLRAKPHYRQVRVLAAAPDGQELIRFDRAEGVIRPVPLPELQAKGGRDYVVQGRSRALGEVYLAPVTLNRERGRIEVPHRLMLRAVAPIPGPTTPPGVAVINLDFAALVSALYPPLPERALYIANAQGDYLVSPTPSQAMAFELGGVARLPADFPQTAGIFSGEANAITARLPDGRIIAARRISAVPGDPSRDLVVASVAAYETVARRELGIGVGALGLTLALLVLAVIVAYLASRRAVRPLAAIQEAAVAIERGQPARLPIDRRDEIGDVARALAHMEQVVREREAALITSNEALEAINADLEQFAHLAAHDLREPARRIAALADLLQLEADLDPTSHDLAERLKQSAQSMLDQIVELRRFSGVGDATVTPEPTDLRALAEAALAPLRPTLDARGVVVTLESLPTRTVVAPQVTALFRALFDNAVQHTPGEGWSLRVYAAGTEVIVENTGVTLEPHQLDSVVRPFVRGVDSPGVGMGLAIARRIVARHGGQLTLRARPDAVEVVFNLEDANA